MTKLKTYLKAQKISVSDFCKQTGFSQRIVYKWLNEGQKPNPASMAKVENFTNGFIKPVDWFSR